MSVEIFTLRERPAFASEFDRLAVEAWPEFLFHADTRHWESLAETFPDFQLLLCDGTDTVVGIGHTIPIPWDGTLEDLPGGIDAIMVRGVECHRAGRQPTALSALAAIVSKHARGRGYSYAILQGMWQIAEQSGLRSLIVPVRPTQKANFPHESIEAYVSRQRNDGLPFDPWLRAHARMGAKLLKVAPRAMLVEGTVAQWEKWTGLRFHGSGEFVVPGALCPIVVDVESDVGRYEEPNVWMEHRGLTSTAASRNCPR